MDDGRNRNAHAKQHGTKHFSTARREERVRVSIGAVKALSFLLQTPLVNVTSLGLGPATGNEIDGTLRLYLRQHFDNMRPVKALDLLRKFNYTGS